MSRITKIAIGHTSAAGSCPAVAHQSLCSPDSHLYDNLLHAWTGLCLHVKGWSAEIRYCRLVGRGGIYHRVADAEGRHVFLADLAHRRHYRHASGMAGLRNRHSAGNDGLPHVRHGRGHGNAAVIRFHRLLWRMGRNRHRSGADLGGFHLRPQAGALLPGPLSCSSSICWPTGPSTIPRSAGPGAPSGRASSSRVRWGSTWSGTGWPMCSSAISSLP